MLTYQCVVKSKMRCTSDEFCASTHCNEVSGSEYKGKKMCDY